MQMLAIALCKRAAVVVALCSLPLAARAEAPVQASQCSVPPVANFFASRESTIVSMQEMPEGCLKSMMLRCGDAANRGLLDPTNAAMCSMGYEALLRKSFGGSFPAMMAWRRVEHEAHIFAP